MIDAPQQFAAARRRRLFNLVGLVSMRISDRPPSWSGLQSVSAQEYDCAYCGRGVATERGWEGQQTTAGGNMSVKMAIVVCPFCGHPTYRNPEGIVPGEIPKSAPGGQLEHLPGDIETAYGEARRCMSVGSYTGCIMVCRKILMHIAVEHGGRAGRHFAEYVDYLDENRLLPLGGKSWAEKIKDAGNQVNHELPAGTEEDALLLLLLLEQILKTLHEIPGKLREHGVSGDSAP